MLFQLYTSCGVFLSSFAAMAFLPFNGSLTGADQVSIEGRSLPKPCFQYLIYLHVMPWPLRTSGLGIVVSNAISNFVFIYFCAVVVEASSSPSPPILQAHTPPFPFPPLGMVAGALFVLSVTFSFAAIPFIGLAMAQGVWGGSAILVAWIWGGEALDMISCRGDTGMMMIKASFPAFITFTYLAFFNHPPHLLRCSLSIFFPFSCSY